jgi:hypothetical protein
MPITDSGDADQATWRKGGEDGWINSNKSGILFETDSRRKRCLKRVYPCEKLKKFCV